LFGFIDQTWLATVKQAGAALGYGQEANAIARTVSGRYVVTDPARRSDVMALRKDPAANAAMAGAFTRANAASLEQQLGRAPSESELYIAHFLGPADAAKLIGLAGQKPEAAAAAQFPQAARANRPIFYERTGAPRSFAAVNAELKRRYE